MSRGCPFNQPADQGMPMEAGSMDTTVIHLPRVMVGFDEGYESKRQGKEIAENHIYQYFDPAKAVLEAHGCAT
ncbi:hypothetical protein N7492_000946 [Penicillium capsulatum]|uniref:Uncharacterized protein n=1 Tax=Penicillium capsulatum TaxID=69766 RepID=A0A9W9IUL5_9EURO|nr:hypothetical protein N7492_000946 [Penicillium capsulatum]